MVSPKLIATDEKIIEAISILTRKLNIDNFSIFKNFYIYIHFFKLYFNFYSYYLENIRKYTFLYDSQFNNKSFLVKHYYLNLYNHKLFNGFFNKTIYNYYSSDFFSKKSKIMIIATNKFNLFVTKLY